MGKFSVAFVDVYRSVPWPESRPIVVLHGFIRADAFRRQGLRIGGALSLSQARKVNVEPGCSVPDPCSSNPCPANSYCRDDWDSHSCTCLAGQFVAFFLLVSVGAAHPRFTLFGRLLRQQLHRRVLAEPLQARINVHEEAELLPRLHLRLFQELLWSLLREKVRFLDSNQRRCAESGRCLLCFAQHRSLKPETSTLCVCVRPQD